MKKLVMLMAVLSLAFSSAVFAQDNKPGAGDKPRGERGNRGDWGKKMQERNLEEMTKVCGLSDEQVKKIKEIQAANGKAMEEWNTANDEKVKEAYKAVGEARKDGDKEKIAAAQKKLEEVTAGRRELMEKGRKEVIGVLTDEQAGKWREHMATQFVDMKYGRAKLTDDQKAKVNEAIKELVKEKDLKPEDFNKKLSEKVDSLLTDEQKKAMAEGGHRGGPHSRPAHEESK